MLSYLANTVDTVTSAGTKFAPLVLRGGIRDVRSKMDGGTLGGRNDTGKLDAQLRDYIGNDATAKYMMTKKRMKIMSTTQSVRRVRVFRHRL